jgi:hypothetical protein
MADIDHEPPFDRNFNPFSQSHKAMNAANVPTNRNDFGRPLHRPCREVGSILKSGDSNRNTGWAE